MDNDYMVLQNRNVKIPLRAKNGTWKFQLNGEKWAIPLCMELLYAYHLIGNQDYRATSATLRANYKHLTPIEIEAFIQHFEKTHPVEEYLFNMDDIPIYATDERPLEIPTDQPYRVLLTPEQEQEVLGLIKKNNTEIDGRKPVNKWFRYYVNRYGLSPRNKNQDFTHHKDLAECFCELHGIKYETLYNIEQVRQIKAEEKKNLWKTSLISIFAYILCKVAIAALGLGAIWLFLYFIYS